MLHASLSATWMYMAYGCLEPTLGLRLEEYGLSSVFQGLIFGIQPFFYMVMTFATPYVVPRWVEHRVTLIVSLFGLGFSQFFVGPFFEEDNLLVMLIGLVLTGIFLGPLVIPNMAEMMRATALRYPDCNRDHANSLLSGMLSSSFGIGQASGPLLGSFIYQVTNFRTMNDVVGIIIILAAVLYLVCAEGCQAFRQTCKNYGKRNDPEVLEAES